MNKVILMGRLTRDPDIRYTQGERQMAIARYTLAVDRRGRGSGNGESTADFIQCVAFDRSAEFAEKYLHQGTKIVVTGRIQTGSYTNKDGQRVYTTDVVVEDQEFAESKSASEANSGGQYSEGYRENRSSGGCQNNNQGQQNRGQTYQQQSFPTDKDGLSDELPFH